MMNIELRRAMRIWQEEVDAESVRLIEEGVPPVEAMEQAKDIVRERRKPKTFQEFAKLRSKE